MDGEYLRIGSSHSQEESGGLVSISGLKNTESFVVCD